MAPSLIEENPELVLLASLSFMEDVGLKIDIAGRQVIMSALGLTDMALRKTPNGHLALSLGGFPPTVP